MNDHNEGQSQPLAGAAAHQTSYGTLPVGGSALGITTSTTGRRHTTRGRRGMPNSPTGAGFPRTNTRGSYYDSHETSPLAIRRPMSVAGLKESIKDQWRSTLKRAPSTYDPPLEDLRGDDVDDAEAARVNGVRVWYSSFTSIDWLHDAVR